MFRITKFKNRIYFLILFIVSFSFLIYSTFNLLSNLNINAFNNTDDTQPGSIKLPVIMYHSILKNKSQKYIVSTEQFENDLIYLKNNNFNTVTVADLIDYIHNDKELPPNPIVITFDDGQLNNLAYAVPLLEKYSMKAIFSVVGYFIEEASKTQDHNPNYSYLNWDDINKMISSNAVEIQCHSYNFHKNRGKRTGANRYIGEPLDNYEKVFSDDISIFMELMEENTGYKPTAFAYPFGACSEHSENLLKKEGFLASFSCYEKLNYISKDNNSLYLLGRFNRSGNISTEAFFKKVLKNY